MNMEMEFQIVTMRVKNGWSASIRIAKQDMCRFGGTRVRVSGKFATGLALIPTEDTGKGTYALTNSGKTYFFKAAGDRVFRMSELDAIYSTRKAVVTATIDNHGHWILPPFLTLDQPPRKRWQELDTKPQAVQTVLSLVPAPDQSDLGDLRAALALVNEAMAKAQAKPVIKADGSFGAILTTEI